MRGVVGGLETLRSLGTDHGAGKGFDVPTTIDRPGSRGLAAMRERLALVDGRLAINSAPSGGTTVTATVPLS